MPTINIKPRASAVARKKQKAKTPSAKKAATKKAAPKKVVAKPVAKKLTPAQRVKETERLLNVAIKAVASSEKLVLRAKKEETKLRAMLEAARARLSQELAPKPAAKPKLKAIKQAKAAA